MPVCEVCGQEFDPDTGVLVRGWPVLCDEHDTYQPLTDRGRKDLEVIQARGSL